MAELKNLEIDEVSFVDDPANPEANILLIKKKEAQTDELNEILKGLTGKLSAQIEKAEEAQYLEIAKKYELLGERAAELAPKLRKLSASAEMYDTAIKALDTALAVVEKSGVFEELGKSGTAPEKTFEQTLTEIKKANPTISERWARDMAYREVNKHGI